MVVPPDEQQRIPTPEVGEGINEGGDEVLVSIRTGALLEGRRHGDRAAQGTQPNGSEPPNGRRQDLIVPRPPQSDGRERHVSREISLEGEGESVYRPMERRVSHSKNTRFASRPPGGGHIQVLQIPSLPWARHERQSSVEERDRETGTGWQIGKFYRLGHDGQKGHTGKGRDPPNTSERERKGQGRNRKSTSN
nr:hypothetical protein Iba_chr13bCG12580 [Ipomoea batatas]